METENKERELVGHADINQTRACARIIKKYPGMTRPLALI